LGEFLVLFLESFWWMGFIEGDSINLRPKVRKYKNLCNFCHWKYIYIYIYITIYLLRKVVCLLKSPKLLCPCYILGTIGRLLPWRRVNQGDLIMFRLTTKELLIIEQFRHWKLNKIKTKNFMKIGAGSWCC
jgi:hypothetical protein